MFSSELEIISNSISSLSDKNILDKDSFKRFLGYYEERMDKLFIYREQDSQISYRKLFQLQAEKIQTSVLNREEYQPFLVR